MLIPRPNPDDFGPFATYIRLPPEGNLLSFLEDQLADLVTLLQDLPELTSLLLHPPYTWSIRRVLGHITDCERVFGFRILWLARDNKTPLPGFDENDFMRAANFDQFPLSELLAEFESLRQSHLHLLSHLTPDAWQRQGTVSNLPMTTAAMAYILAGHAQHHLAILHQRLK